MGSTSQSGHLLDVGDEWWVLFVDWCYRYTERRSKTTLPKPSKLVGSMMFDVFHAWVKSHLRVHIYAPFWKF